VVRRIIGPGGQKMKDIVARTNGEAKLRLRGKGSGFVERDTKVESPEPLQLCVSCPRSDSYAIAIRAAEDLLREIYGLYDDWCVDTGKSDRAPEIRMAEKHHWGEGDDGTPADGGRNRRGGKNRKPKPQAVQDAPGGYNDGDEEAADDADRGPRPENAPSHDEIEQRIEDRNQARKSSDYSEADRIRDLLKSQGVVLSDEKGAHGSGSVVTSWRYWKE